MSRLSFVLFQEEPFYTRMPPKQLQGRPEWDEVLRWDTVFASLGQPAIQPPSFLSTPDDQFVLQLRDFNSSWL